MEYLETQRGQKALIYDGRSFRLKDIYRNGNKRWVCRTVNCKGSILTNANDKILKEQVHACVSDVAKIEVEKRKKKSYKRCREELTPVPTLYKQTYSDASDQGLDFVPTFRSSKSSMYRHRQTAFISLSHSYKNENQNINLPDLDDFVGDRLEMLEAISYRNGELKILDQLLLPIKTKYQEISSVEDGWNAIKTMKVRGAPAISIVAALSLAVELNGKEFSSKDELYKYVKESLQYLSTSRPTAVNLVQVAYLITDLAEELSLDNKITPDLMKKRLLEEIGKLLQTDIRINTSIGEHGGKHIINCSEAPISILTHCNTGSLATAGYGTALGVIRWLHENNKLDHVYCTETRPYNQGARLTAYELVHDKIPATLICDSMVSALMKSRKISAVVVGADRVVANGDTANKIGTYQIAVCAKYHNVPFYVASPRSTLDFSMASGDLIPIEERPHSEMTSINSTRIAAEGINCWNPAFDVTPAELITGGIITEVGVYLPSSLNKEKKLLEKAEIFSK